MLDPPCRAWKLHGADDRLESSHRFLHIRHVVQNDLVTMWQRCLVVQPRIGPRKICIYIHARMQPWEEFILRISPNSMFLHPLAPTQSTHFPPPRSLIGSAAPPVRLWAGCLWDSGVIARAAGTLATPPPPPYPKHYPSTVDISCGGSLVFLSPLTPTRSVSWERLLSLLSILNRAN